ncbi:MAG: metallophosphoesterase [Clostridia bacterium]|nr:metallophosphoesterase [Clostridia bacterium]
MNNISLQSSTTAKPLRFKNGKIKIMHITDTHYFYDNVDASVWLLACACDREKPDVVVVTGDNVDNCPDAKDTKYLIDKLMSVFDERNIPVAITFGNHDSERGAMSREELMAYYNTHSSSISVDDGDELSGCGTYNIPVLSSDGSLVVFNLWIFDSNDYDDEGHYGCVLPDQVEWYKRRSDELKNANDGNTVYSLAFQHIIVDDVYRALKKTKVRIPFSYHHMYNKKEFYSFYRDGINFGALTETPCSGYHNYGQFDAMVEKGDVLAMFSGHDHTNAFAVRYRGIDISNTVSSRYNRDRFSSQYGYRIITVDESDTSVYKTNVVHWYGMFKSADAKALISSGDKFGAELVKNVIKNGLKQRLLQTLLRSLGTVFGFRRITYPDC